LKGRAAAYPAAVERDHGDCFLNSLLFLTGSSGNVLARHHNPLRFHVAFYVFRTIDHELLDIGLLEMLVESLDVSPHLVDHEEVRIGSIPVNVKLKRPRFGSRFFEIGKHAPFVSIGFAWLRSMLGDEAIRARLSRS
jgi:hypothetical protein